SVFVVRMFVANRFRRRVGSDFWVKPTACVEAPSLAGQRQSPLAEFFFEFPIAKFCEVPNSLYSQCVQVLLRHFSNTGNIAHVERGKKLRFFTWHDEQNTVWFGLG